MSRVFHGPNNIAGAAGLLARTQRSLGWDATSMCYPAGKFGYQVDEELRPGARSRATLLASSRRFDVFHFYYGDSLNGSRLTDIPMLKRMGKKIFFYFCGCDIRDSKLVIDTHPISACAECWPMGCSVNRDQVARVAADADGCFVSTPDLLEFMPNAVLLPQPIDLVAFDVLRDGAREAPVERDPSVLRIVHAPSSRTIKGTRYVESAIEALQRDGVPVELVLVEGKTHAESLAIYASCDIAVDQLLIGAYGQFSVEAMALGMPVVCYLRDDVRAKYAPELPIVSATPSTLAQVILDLWARRDTWAESGRVGVQYVERVHAAPVVAQIAIDAYERAGAHR